MAQSGKTRKILKNQVRVASKNYRKTSYCYNECRLFLVFSEFERREVYMLQQPDLDYESRRRAATSSSQSCLVQGIFLRNTSVTHHVRIVDYVIAFLPVL